ncbi:shikimate dehydrogenase [Enterobacteriaceae bacterium LUAb1]
MSHFAVFGNPINHSKSPQIHRFFAEQTGIAHCYSRICAPLDGFSASFRHFIAEGGEGGNVTTPFKQDAWKLAEKLSEHALLAGAVNTLKKLPDGQIFGENTDGIGLLSDLKRLAMIDKGERILLIGAGGAARGVIQPLLEFGTSVVITNRTLSRAEELVPLFEPYGSVQAIKSEKLTGETFDLIINATSSGLQGEVPELDKSLINKKTRCYDMLYSRHMTPFLHWCQLYGAEHCADGLGMLVSQAAHAFHLWYGTMPEIMPVIAALKSEMA